MAAVMSEDRPHHRRKREHSPGFVATYWAPALVLIPPVVIIGGVHATVQLGLLITYTTVFAVQFLRNRFLKRPFVWHPIVLFTGGLAVLSVLQTVAVPFDWVQAISPRAAEAQAQIGHLFSNQPDAIWMSLSVDHSSAAAVRWWALTMGLMLLLQSCRHRRSRRAALNTVVGLAAIVVVVGLIQVIADVDRIWGVYQPLNRHAQVGWAGPFVGSNHCSHFLLIGAAICLIQLSTAKASAGSHAAYGITFGLAVVCIVANGSRGALIGVTIAIVLVFVLAMSERLRNKPRIRLGRVLFTVSLGFAMVGLLALEVDQLRDYLNLDRLGEQVRLSRLGLWETGWGFIHDFPLIGVGADAMSSIQVALAPMGEGRPLHLSFIENDYLQIAIDFGIVAPLGLLLTSYLIARRNRNHSRRRFRRVWLIVIVPFAFYSAFSFSLPILGVILPGLGVFTLQWLSGQTIEMGKKAGFLVLTGLIVLSVVIAMQHPSLQRQDQVGHDREGMQALMQRAPLDGRHLWSVATGWGEGVLSEEELIVVAMRTAAISGNDALLQEVLGRALLLLDQWEPAGAILTQAVSNDPRLLQQAGAWAELIDDWRVIEQLCRQHQLLVEPLLNALIGLQRSADVLFVSLALDDTPQTLYFRIVAARGLGETDLVRGFSTHIELELDDDMTDCIWRSRAFHTTHQLGSALRQMSHCVDLEPDNVSHLTEYLDWALSDLQMARDHQTDIDRHIESLNFSTGSLPNARRQYYQYLTMAQARDESCHAASLSYGRTQTATGRFPRLPVWVGQLCPGLE